MISTQRSWHLIPFNKIIRLNIKYIPWWILSDWYLKNYDYPKNSEMKIFKQMLILKIKLLTKAQMALSLIK